MEEKTILKELTEKECSKIKGQYDKSNNTCKVDICQTVKNFGLNVVGCQRKEYAHIRRYTIFLKDETDDKEILKYITDAGLQSYGFLERGKFKHGANKLLRITTEK